MTSPALPTGLCERLHSVRTRLAEAAARAGRPPPRLVAVTKSVAEDFAARLLALGQLDLGESRVQVLEAKAAALCGTSPARWHLIGHLQQNKARRAVAWCHSIHSVDSLRLLAALERLALELGKRPMIYLEVDYVRDGTRSGLAEDQVLELVLQARTLSQVQLAGLMTIAPVPDFDGDTRRARQVFARLRRCSEQLPQEAFAGGRPLLSMGMSTDFEVAAEEGSDVVRVGSALFEGVESDS